MFNQLDGLVINLPFGIIGKAIDKRSQVQEPHFYRDYLSVAEVLDKLSGETPEHTVEIRKGKFPIYVTPEGGPTSTWWFLNGTEDDDLVEMFPVPAVITSGVITKPYPSATVNGHSNLVYSEGFQTSKYTFVSTTTATRVADGMLGAYSLEVAISTGVDDSISSASFNIPAAKFMLIGLGVKRPTGQGAVTIGYGGATLFGTIQVPDDGLWHYVYLAQASVGAIAATKISFQGQTGTVRLAHLQVLAFDSLSEQALFFQRSVYVKMAEPRIFYGNSIPDGVSHKTYNTGDWQINTEPTAGTPMLWRCTAGGNPGTWIAAGSFTTSSELRAILSDETGTGLAVFNNAPTFIGPVRISDLANSVYHPVRADGSGALGLSYDGVVTGRPNNTYTIVDADRSLLFITDLGIGTVIMPNPVSYPYRRLSLRNGTPYIITLSVSVVFSQTLPAKTTLLPGEWMEASSDAINWLMIGGGTAIDSHSVLAYAGSLAIDFASGDNMRTVTLTGNITFTTSNKAVTRARVIRLVSDGTLHTLAWPVGWTWLGIPAPSSLAASKTAILSLVCYGTLETDVVAAYSAQV